MEDTQKKINEIISIKKNLEKDLVILTKGKKQAKTNVYFGKNVKLEPNVFFDTSDGKILIDDNTKIKANAVLRGPLIVGKNCVINSFTEISCSRIGNVCKIGGEIDQVVMQDYSNKQHYGYLGHSYVGSWVNLGAGTSVSTLKNTYTNIKVNDFDTGTQFFGCIIGDCVKTAINTSIFCGKVIGASSHLYGTVTEDVPSFVSHIRPGVFYEIPFEIAENIQKAMTKRRNINWTEKDSQTFKKSYLATSSDRKKVKAKKGKLSFK